MNKHFFTCLAIGAAMVLTGCQEQHKNHQTKTVYTFADGTRAYQADDGIWWYLWLQNQNQNYGSNNGQAVWTRGNPPSSYNYNVSASAKQNVDEEDIDNDADVSLEENDTLHAEAESDINHSGSEVNSESDSGFSDNGGSSDAGSSDAGSSDAGSSDSGGGGGE